MASRCIGSCILVKLEREITSGIRAECIHLTGEDLDGIILEGHRRDKRGTNRITEDTIQHILGFVSAFPLGVGEGSEDLLPLFYTCRVFKTFTTDDMSFRGDECVTSIQ